MDKSYHNIDLICRNIPTNPVPVKGKILITGATGYIGGRLVPELLARGYSLRILVRSDTHDLKIKYPDAEIFIGDALDSSSLERALKDIWLAYYLIHSFLLGKGKFKDADTLSAKNFIKAAEKNGVKRIVYLGGLGNKKSWLSPHLKSRLEVARVLKSGTVPATILRAAIIIGSGSASYEIIKNLIKNLPVLFIPPWARTRCQPISVRDVIKYLVGVIETEETTGKEFDIGGPDILSYEEMLMIQADIIGKKVLFIHFPFNIKKIYAYFVSLLTPVPRAITKCLMGSVMNEVVCKNFDINNHLPFLPISYKESLLKALSAEERDDIRSKWSDSFPPAHSLALKLKELKSSPQYIKTFSISSQKNSVSLFNTICKIGGKDGWFYYNWIWRWIGMLDNYISRSKKTKSRTYSSELQVNDIIDSWRVEDIKLNKMLLIRAEMKMPGKAWLRFNIDQEKDKNILSVTTYFYVTSIFGKLYWFGFLPFHYFIFSNLIRQIDVRS